jgi:outer membrane protein assembly factor BamB
MRSFEIFVAPALDDALALKSAPASGERTQPAPFSIARGDAPRRGPRDVLDIFIGGANVTALVTAAHGVPASAQVAPTSASVGGVLRDLGTAALELSSVARAKRIVRLHDDPWELCIERWGDDATLSVYRGGGDPIVAVHDRVVPFADVRASASEAIRSLLDRGTSPPALAFELSSLHDELARTPVTEGATVTSPSSILPPVPVAITGDDCASFSLSSDLYLREGAKRAYESSVERTDMHALLFEGTVRARVREREIDLGHGHPFLLAERLVDIAGRVLDAWERGAPYHMRTDAGGVLIGVRLGPDGVLALTLAGDKATSRQNEAFHTFPALRVSDFVDASVAFGRSIARALLRRDRSQSNNLRLSAFRRQLREIDGLLREACRDDAKTNPSPESYRAFAAARQSAVASKAPRERDVEPPTRLRYSARWRALVPGIDLRSTFLCGDRLIVGGLDETFGLDRATGEVLWRVATEKATSVVTPGGIARLRADGELSVHDFGTGEVTLRSWLAPRTGGPPAGAVVNVPGLPRLLILTEGERHLVAVDLTSGEPRWRFAWGRRGTLRLKRAGKLLYYTGGDSALTALDVLSGSIVWRTRDRLRFRAPPTLDHDLLFALAGGAGSRAHLHAIDAFSGQRRWTQQITTTHDTCTIEGGPHVVRDVVVSAVREGQGLRLVAMDRDTGAPRWTSPSAVAPAGTSWLAVDDLLIGNTPTGELLAIEASTGEARYRHLLGTVLETDIPRRLEPVLRSGALFVPHSNVHVFRPRDGAQIGVIGPSEAIPDLLRVDERCDVYIAEESGHVVSFAAGPRLSLVKG